jgi:hypothetical protein
LRGLHAVLLAYFFKHPLALILEYAVFFLHLQSPRQSLEASLQAALESFMQTPVVVHEKISSFKDFVALWKNEFCSRIARLAPSVAKGGGLCLHRASTSFVNKLVSQGNRG